MFSAHYSTQRHYGYHILRFCSPLVTVQNTICGSAHSCSPDDGHNDDRNMLRWKFDNKHQISCILLVSLSSPYIKQRMNFTSGAQIVGDQISYRGARYFQHNYCNFFVRTYKNVHHFICTSRQRQVTARYRWGHMWGCLSSPCHARRTWRSS